MSESNEDFKQAASGASRLLNAYANLDEKLSIVIAVLDSLSYTKECINSILKYAPKAEIIVVDNGSQPETRAYLDSVPQIKKIRWKTNKGVSKAWNAGLKIASREILCVLNNDVIVQPNGLQTLVAAALEHDIAGNEGACMNMDFNYAYNTYSAEESDYIGGYCIVFTRDVWNNVGQFDELFSPAYWEDNDWSLRARQAGYKWQIIGNCVYHYVARTSSRVLDMGSLFAQQRVKFINKWAVDVQGLGERILIDCYRASPLSIQQCLTEIRAFKPMAKIQLKIEQAESSSYTGHDCAGMNRHFQQYTQEIHCDEYLSRPLFSFITWVNDESHYRNLLKSAHNLRVEYIKLGKEFDSLSKAYNAGTALAKGQYLIYVHQDVEILDTLFTQKVVKLFNSRKDLGFVGVIGSLSKDKAKAVWFFEGAHSCRGIAIQNRYEAINLSVYDGPAALIDGLMMITDKKFNFPESLPHIHLLDAWMCNVAAEEGWQNWITDIWVNHNSGGETHSEYFRNNLIRYRIKWFTDNEEVNSSSFNDVKLMLKNLMLQEDAAKKMSPIAKEASNV